VRVWVGYRDRVPDVAVTCDRYDVSEAPDILHSPKLIIEVLSAKRGGELDKKLNDYQGRPSIEEYVIIDSRKRWVQRHWRSDGRRDFETDPIRISGSVTLSSVNYTLDIDDLYRLVRYRGA
jgi:Uma2 family endonuclease